MTKKPRAWERKLPKNYVQSYEAGLFLFCCRFIEKHEQCTFKDCRKPYHVGAHCLTHPHEKDAPEEK